MQAIKSPQGIFHQIQSFAGERRLSQVLESNAEPAAGSSCMAGSPTGNLTGIVDNTVRIEATQPMSLYLIA
jgi:hypothetical protein